MVIGNLDIIIKMHAVESVLPRPDGYAGVITALLCCAISEAVGGRGRDTFRVAVLIAMNTRGISEEIRR